MAQPRDNLPWVEKYRPETLSDVVSNEATISTIFKFVDAKRLPHMLLHGPPGTGKTSTILAVARHLYKGRMGESVLQFNASDDRGINVIRNNIKPFAQCVSQGNIPKLIILDEADQMTQAAQNALRRIMEEYATNVRFCLVCNYISKIHDAIQSRCTRFRFHPLLDNHVVATITKVCSEERIELVDDTKEVLLKLGNGDMRRILNTLQATTMAHLDLPVTGDMLMSTLGLPLQKEIESVLQVLFASDFETSFRAIEEIVTKKGYSVTNISTALQNLCWEMSLPETTLIQIMIRFGDMEKRLAEGSSEYLEMAALVSIFVEANLENSNVYKAQQIGA